tara:strand:+ start:134 stop:340 length:207 start_codon:yes stop_codon:yes gene_type:complete
MKKTSHSDPVFVSINFIADKMGFHPETVRQWASGKKKKPDGFPNGARVSNRWLFKAEEVENFLNNLSG